MPSTFPLAIVLPPIAVELFTPKAVELKVLDILLKALVIFLTLLVSQLLMSWLKFVALKVLDISLKALVIFLTLVVSQLLVSWLKFVALKVLDISLKRLVISVTWLVCQLPGVIVPVFVKVSIVLLFIVPGVGSPVPLFIVSGVGSPVIVPGVSSGSATITPSLTPFSVSGTTSGAGLFTRVGMLRLPSSPRPISVNFFNFVLLLNFLSLPKYSVYDPHFHLPTKICMLSRSNFSSLLAFFNAPAHHSGYVSSKNSFFKFCCSTFIATRPSSFNWLSTLFKLTHLSAKSLSASSISFLFFWGKFSLSLRSASAPKAFNLINIPSPLIIFLLNSPI